VPSNNEHRGYQQWNFAALALLATLGVDDPVGHRLGTWGVGNYAANIYLVIVLVLDDLGDCIYARGFGDGFHKGIVSLMIPT
jgi:hypothetical protein